MFNGSRHIRESAQGFGKLRALIEMDQKELALEELEKLNLNVVDIICEATKNRNYEK